MAQTKKIEAVTFYDGRMVINVCCSAANDDWIRAARLKMAADNGDEAARKELERLQGTSMLEEVED